MDKSWRVIFAFAGIFVAGVVAGLLLAPRFFDNVMERRWQQQASRPGRPPIQRALPLGPQLFTQFTEQLNLTPEQREKIKPIEGRITEELRRLRQGSQRNTELALERMQDEISAVLTPEQSAQFQARIAEGRERVKNRIQSEEGRGRRGEMGPPNRPREGPPPK
ncbi:MAG: hypothetical protein ABIZ81_10985 [Opitutaceae bacterium]